MKNKSIALLIEKPAISDTEKFDAASTVARLLGYTETESDFADDVLTRFTWRRPMASENN